MIKGPYDRYSDDVIRVWWNPVAERIEAGVEGHEVSFPRGDQPTLTRIREAVKTCPVCQHPMIEHDRAAGCLHELDPPLEEDGYRWDVCRCTVLGTESLSR